MNEKLSNRLSVLSFTMTIGMVLYHCGMPESNAINSFDYYLNNSVTRIFDLIGILGMTYFYTTSAFLLFINLNIHNYLQKIKKRIFSLFIPYLIWNIIFTILPLQKKYSFNEFINNVFLLGGSPPDLPIWYVYIVFLLAFISPLFLLIFKNELIGFIFLIILTSIDVWFYSRVGTSATKPILLTIAYMPSYMLGAYMGIHHCSRDELQSIKWCMFYLLLTYLGREYVESTITSCSLCGTVVLMIYVFPVSKVVPKNILKLSFLIYVSHAFFIRFARIFRLHIIMKICKYMVISNILGRLMVAVLVIIIIGCIVQLLNKKCPIILKIISGGRIKNVT